ncbi:transmembrane and death domain protein 1 [Myripristis murdjan]|uniref:transmembrane and death domain protein 1 n=1 Tax=Myripristis murdjan TaxID=586833 RepID=UPI001175F00B|nr:uncharacterized protein C12orf81-like [Myripristis murdjan]
MAPIAPISDHTDPTVPDGSDFSPAPLCRPCHPRLQGQSTTESRGRLVTPQDIKTQGDEPPETPSFADDTDFCSDPSVAEDIGEHQLERLVELLTSTECEDLLFVLSHPEENIFEHLERLSPEKNQLDLKHRVRRDASSAAGGEAQCRTALTDWLLKYGEQTYYDRLSRALQHIGRTDIAVEVGKNINQDKALSLKRYVEDYHKYVSSLKFPSVQPDSDSHHHTEQRVRGRRVRDLTWQDLDLIVEQVPIPPDQSRLLNAVWPLLYGFLLGFFGTFLMSISIFLLIIHISSKTQLNHEPSSSSHMLMVGDVIA